MGKNIYVGMRYVPLVVGDWDNTKNTEYEPLSVVTYSGNSYTSKKDVPIGIDITNTDFWIKTADYNVQVAQYKNDVESYISSNNAEINSINNTLDTANENINNLSESVDTLNTEFPLVKDKVNLLPITHISTADPTPTDGADGDIWIKYVDLPPTAIDSITITNATITGCTVKANKASVPQYWDADNTNAIITFDVYVDGSSTPYGNYTWAQISSGVVISGQNWTGGTSHSIVIKTKSVTSSKTDYSTAISTSFTPLASPTGVVATNGSSNVNLGWSAVIGATSYNIKRSTTNGSGYVTIASGITTPSFNDTSVSNGTTYYYVISASNANGESANSVQVTGAPKVIQAQWLQWEFADNQSGAPSPTNVYMELAEIEVNSPDIVPTTQANWSASSIFGTGFEAYHLGDNVYTDTNRWVSATADPQWVKVNLGSLQNIVNFRFYNNQNVSTPPKHVNVYRSTLATPSAKTYGVTNADWILAGTYTIDAVAGGGFTPYKGFTTT